MNDDNNSYLYNYYNGNVYQVDYSPPSLFTFSTQYNKVSHQPLTDMLPTGDVILSIWHKTSLPVAAFPYAFAYSARYKKFRMYEGLISETMSTATFADPAYPADPEHPYTREEHYHRVNIMPKQREQAETDEDLYNAFKRTMEDMRNTSTLNKQLEYTSHTKKTGPCTISTLPTVLTARYNRRFANCDTPIATGILPKLTGKKTDKSVRLVYPMSNSYDYTTAVCFQKLYNPEHHNIFYVKGPKFPNLKYTYDVKNMDIAIYPYLLRYATETKTQELFLPPAIYGDMIRYPRQMPSGAAYTTLVGQCFTTAIINTTNRKPSQHYYIQGDGIMTNDTIDHPLLKREADYTINGFNYETKIPRYVNAKKKLNSPRYNKTYIGSRAAKTKRDARAYVYYEILHAKDIDTEGYKHELTTNPFIKKTKDFKAYNTNNNVCPRLLTYIEGKQHDGVYSDTATTISSGDIHHDINVCSYDYDSINNFYYH